MVYVVFRDDPNTLRVYIERRSPGHFGEFMRMTERISERLIALARRSGYRLESATVSLYSNTDSLYSNTDFITSGERHTFRKRLLGRFSETIFGDVVVGFLTFLLAGALTQKWMESAAVGVASVLCFCGVARDRDQEGRRWLPVRKVLTRSS